MMNDQVDSDGLDQSFDRFFRRMFPQAARAAALAIGDPGIGAQLAQESLLRVYQRWSKYADETHARNSMYRILMNLTRDHLRRQKWSFVTEDPYTLVQVPIDAADVDERIIVQEAMRKLSKRQRMSLVLVDFVGLSSEEAAAVMGGSSSTVRVHLMRGRKKLRASLDYKTRGGQAS